MSNSQNKLTKLYNNNLIRNINYKTQINDPAYINIDNKTYLNFTSNDYLGLSNHPQVIDAAQQAIAKYGISASSSTWVNGLTDIHLELTTNIANWLNQPKALLFSCGFMANIGCIQALCSRKDIIFHDKNNHASLLTGVKLTNCQNYRYQHLNTEDLIRLITKYKSANNWIVTDGVFSMSGKIAPLQKLTTIAHKYQAKLIVDDAHGIGVLGAHGTGSYAELKVNPSEASVQIITFGKAIGTMGAAVIGNQADIELIEQSANSLAFTTAMPPAIAASSIASIDLIRYEPSIRDKLSNNLKYFNQIALSRGIVTEAIKTPIIKIPAHSIQTSLNWHKYLQKQGVLVHPVRPPSVNTPGIRIIISANHTQANIDQLTYHLQILLNNF